MTYCRELTQKVKNDIVKKITSKNIKWIGNRVLFNNQRVYGSDNAQAIIECIETIERYNKW